MRIRYKIFLGYFLAAGIAFFSLWYWIDNEVRKQYLKAIEDSIVDMTNTLAVLLESDIKENELNLSLFQNHSSLFTTKHFDATIYELHKTSIETGIYITDKNGIVIFDSNHPQNMGADFSKWRNIHRTLKGKYGARSTRSNPNDPTTSILHITAPIKNKSGKLIATVTVYKPIQLVSHFIAAEKQKIIFYVIAAFIMLTLLSWLISHWVTAPLINLKTYIENLTVGNKIQLPQFGKHEIAKLANSFEAMYNELEGKKYIEEYIQTLTHELKSPLSGIQGALELLTEHEMSLDEQRHFFKNIQHETERMHKIVERMLLLSKLENRSTVEHKESIELVKLLHQIINTSRSKKQGIQIILHTTLNEAFIVGDSLLIYEAIDNVINNAIRFIEERTGEIDIYFTEDINSLHIKIEDNGSGIPEYGIKRIFEKFYSLPSPNSPEKSSGLGLSITQEIITLHNGTIELASQENCGTTVDITFPKQ